MNTAVSLRLFSEDEYREFFELAVASYAQDNAAAGRWHAGEAIRLAREEAERLLAQGTKTPNHHLLAVIHPSGEPVVGFIWFAALRRGAKTVAFVYQLIVKPEYRRRGYGRAALLAAERFARAAGYSSMALHVFAHNAAAIALYRSVGYEMSSLNMQKALVPDHA